MENFTILNAKITNPDVFYLSLIVCGVEKTGQVIIYNRAALYREKVEHPVLPMERLQVTKEGSSVTCLDLEEELLVTGSSDGSVCLYNLETGKMVERLSQAEWSTAVVGDS